jgi:hypothetical protein
MLSRISTTSFSFVLRSAPCQRSTLVAAAAPCLLLSCAFALPLGPYQSLGPPASRPWPQSCASPWRGCAQRAAAGSVLQSTPTPARFFRLCSSSCVVTGISLQTMHWSRGFVRYAPGWLHLTAGKCRCLFRSVSNYKSWVAIGSLCSWKGKERRGRGGVVDASRVRVWCESRTQNWNWSSNTETLSLRESL